jgi:hypothetical protein
MFTMRKWNIRMCALLGASVMKKNFAGQDSGGGHCDIFIPIGLLQ